MFNLADFILETETSSLEKQPSKRATHLSEGGSQVESLRRGAWFLSVTESFLQEAEHPWKMSFCYFHFPPLFLLFGCLVFEALYFPSSLPSCKLIIWNITAMVLCPKQLPRYWWRFPWADSSLLSPVSLKSSGSRKQRFPLCESLWPVLTSLCFFRLFFSFFLIF